MILVVDSDRDVVMKLRMKLYYLNLLSVGAGYRAVRKRMEDSRFSIILFPRPDDPGRPPRFFETLAKWAKSVPSVVLGCDETRLNLTDPSQANLLIYRNCVDKTILRLITEVCRAWKRKNPFDRIAGGVRDRTEYLDLTLYGYPAIFSRSERLFLRALILSYPASLSSEEIGKLTARPGEPRKSRNALCIIASRINHKAAEVVNRKIVRIMAGGTYRIENEKVVLLPKHPIPPPEDVWGSPLPSLD